MKLVPHKYFEKRFKRLPKHIQEKALATMRLFTARPFDATLRNHALSGQQQGLRSVNVTGDYRIIYDPINQNTAILVDIGTHSQLYG